MPPQAASVKTEKATQVSNLPHLSHKALLTQTHEAAQGFCFTLGSEFKQAETKLREKHAIG
ncbi:MULTISPECIES: hypothetical protein [Desulfitobacterium]|uniref:hypothetical protein n=1 Tax=Desulfitobacterium TaxID=36853 RepID=UPI00037094A4|nr:MULTISPECIES: hypothetical protein [Desulfitobacterium]